MKAVTRALALVTALAVLAGVPAPALAQGRPAAAATAPKAAPPPRTDAVLTPTPAGGALAPIASDYVIGPGDVVQISVWKQEGLSRIAPVRPDGKLSMPLLHDIQAAGLTAMQLRDKIATALAELLPNPEVAVTITEVRSMRVSVLGEVERPGVLELRGATTILEAIAMAGGFQPFASPSKITILRTEPNGQTKRIRFNYNRVVSASGTDENILLHPGDVVIVP